MLWLSILLKRDSLQQELMIERLSYGMCQKRNQMQHFQQMIKEFGVLTISLKESLLHLPHHQVFVKFGIQKQKQQSLKLTRIKALHFGSNILLMETQF